MVRPMWLLAWWPVLGCARDLPDSPLGPEAVTIFREFEGDPAVLVDAVTRMDTVMDGLDLEARPGQRLFDVPELTLDDLGGATVQEGLDTSDQMRASMVGLSSHGVDDNLLAQVQENMTCANADAVKCHQRLPVGDSDTRCFLDGDCDTWRGWNTLRLETPLVDFWLEAPGDFRRLTLQDGRPAAVGRTWVERTFENDNGKREWEQRFGVDLFVEDPADAGRTRRYYATWVGPGVGGPTGALMQTALRHGLDDGFTRPDDWLDDRSCDVDLGECLADAPF